MSSAGFLQSPATAASTNDRRWPTRFRPVLSKLAAEGREFFGSSPITIEPLSELRRPYSALLRVRVAAGYGTRGAYIKILEPRADTPAELAATRQNVQREFESTKLVRIALAGRAGLEAVRPIACFPDEFALVTEEVDGPTLSAMLVRLSSGWPARGVAERTYDALRLCAAWLKAVQSALPAARAVTSDTVKKYLDRRLDELGKAARCRLTDRGRAMLERYRDRLLAGVAADGLGPAWIHADFCPDNIIVREGQVTVLDFTMAGSGTHYHDLAHLFLSLDAMRAKPWFRPAIVDRLQRELLEAFEPGLDADRPLFALARFQHVLCHLVSLQTVTGHVARLYADRQHRRYRSWLQDATGLGREGWAR